MRSVDSICIQCTLGECKFNLHFKQKQVWKGLKTVKQQQHQFLTPLKLVYTINYYIKLLHVLSLCPQHIHWHVSVSYITLILTSKWNSGRISSHSDVGWWTDTSCIDSSYSHSEVVHVTRTGIAKLGGILNRFIHSIITANVDCVQDGYP